MMSKTWLIAAAWLLTSVAASAQEPEAWRPKYVNLSFVSQKLDFGEGEKLKSRFGAAFTTGRSYYLHKKPVAGMIRFGIDATWIDLSYANYSREETYDDGYGTEIEKLTAHQAEIGMQVGPSVTVRPLRKLQAHLYFRFAPSFAGLYDGDAFRGNYASFFVTGLSVSYGVIGLGIEKRWGKCRYKEFGGGEDEYGDYGYAEEPYDTHKLKTSGLRAYVNFRF